MEEYLKVLTERIIECITLCIPEDKMPSVENLMNRHISELSQSIKDTVTEELLLVKFSRFINKVLSTVEAVGLSQSQWRAVRKLLLQEIYGCQELILKTIREEKNAEK